MYSIKMRSSNQDVHISGAETICEFDKIEQTVQRFYNKGFIIKVFFMKMGNRIFSI